MEYLKRQEAKFNLKEEEKAHRRLFQRFNNGVDHTNGNLRLSEQVAHVAPMGLMAGVAVLAALSMFTMMFLAKKAKSTSTRK